MKDGQGFFDFMKNMMGLQQEPQYEPLAPLSTKEAQEWDRINIVHAKGKSMVDQADAKRKLYWGKIERKTGIYDRSLKIDNGMIMVEPKKNNCKSKGQLVPGFCDGDCDNCALGKEETEE